MIASASTIDQELLDAGYVLRETSPSGSRYYDHPDGRKAGVSNHAPNAKTLDWMKRNKCVGYRTDLPPYNGVDPMSLAPANTPDVPGIWRGLPDADYHAWDLCSNSRLSDLAVSPEMCEWVRKHGKEQTDAMSLGTALHTALLEPDLLEREFVEPQPCQGRFNPKKGETEGRLCGAMSAKPYGDPDNPEWLCGKHSKGRTDLLDLNTLTADQRKALGHMRTRVMRYHDAQRLLDLADDRELPITFDQDELLCKARVDFYHRPTAPRVADGKGHHGILGDVKTCPDSTDEAFARKVFNMGYFRQLAFYRRALLAHGMPVQFAAIVAVQTAKPYAARVYHVTSKQLDLGDEDLDRLLTDYRQREISGDWIGNGGRAVELEMPVWAQRKIEQRVDPVAAE